MSWRLLFLTLLIAVGASALAGMQLGDWLVQRAPVAVPAPGEDDPDPEDTVLDANGRPYMQQPPQPLVNGTLGVPEQPTADANWQISTVSLFETTSDPNVLISRNRLGAGEAQRLAQAAGDRLQGPQDVLTVEAARPGEGSNPSPIPGQAPLTYADPAMQGQTQNPSAAATQPGWHQAFQAEMAKCSQAGFFDRPTCAWNARNRYCAPNNAWGKVDGCPRRSF